MKFDSGKLVITLSSSMTTIALLASCGGNVDDRMAPMSGMAGEAGSSSLPSAETSMTGGTENAPRKLNARTGMAHE